MVDYDLADNGVVAKLHRTAVQTLGHLLARAAHGSFTMRKAWVSGESSPVVKGSTHLPWISRLGHPQCLCHASWLSLVWLRYTRFLSIRKLLSIWMLINPRHACAARVTVLGLHVSWGAIFSVRGEGGRKGGKKGRGQRSKGEGKFKCHEKRKR